MYCNNKKILAVGQHKLSRGTNFGIIALATSTTTAATSAAAITVKATAAT